MKYLEAIDEDSDGNLTPAYIYIYGSMYAKKRKMRRGTYRPGKRYTLSRRENWWILSDTIWVPNVLYESFYAMHYHDDCQLERLQYEVE